MMKTKVIVLGVSRYSFADQKTGEVIEGTKVHYVEASQNGEENNIGHTPQTANMPFRYFDDVSFNPIPAIADCNLRIDLTGRKPSIKVIGFDNFVGIDFKERINAKAQ